MVSENGNQEARVPVGFELMKQALQSLHNPFHSGRGPRLPVLHFGS